MWGEGLEGTAICFFLVCVKNKKTKENHSNNEKNL